MQFVDLDVDRFESHDHLRIGTFSSGLNAIVSSRETGRNRLVRWLRSMIVGRDVHYGDGSVTSDRVKGSIEVRLGEFRVRMRPGDYVHDNGYGASEHNRAGQRHLSATQRQALAEMLSVESDSAAVRRLEDLACRLGIDRPAVETRGGDRTHRMARQFEILEELKRLDGLGGSREALLDRRRQLELELERLRREPPTAAVHETTFQRQAWEQDLLAAESEVRSLSSTVEDLDRAIARARTEAHSLAATSADGGGYETIAGAYRERMAQLDGQLYRWRQTLRELRAYRDRLKHNEIDARLDGQIGDRVSSLRQPDPRSALRTLESRIINMRRQLDELLGRYNEHRDEEAHEARVAIPESLRTMQKDLYEVCQQLSLHESLATRESLIEQTDQLQRCENELLCAIEKLIAQRGELLQAIADEYHVSREKIALAFGEGCQCEDHPRLADWLLCDHQAGPLSSGGLESTVRYRSQADVQRLEEERWRAGRQLDDARQRIRDLRNQLLRLGDVRPTMSTARLESDVLRDLDQVARNLRDLDARHRLETELDEIRRLDRVAHDSPLDSAFRRIVDRHTFALGGSLPVQSRRWGNLDTTRSYDLDGWPSRLQSRPRSTSTNSSRYTYRDFDSPRMLAGAGNGRHYEAIPAAILETALRLAIVECLAQRGHAIPLVLDATLDYCPTNLKEIAIHHLSRFAVEQRQQVILLTSDPHVERLVHEVRGNTLEMRLVGAPVREALDINRQLTAYANDHEAEKWSVPDPFEPTRVPRLSRPERTRSRFFLNEHSPIEELTSIDRTSVEKLQASGVQRIGELLDAEPRWLVEIIGAAAVDDEVVRTWQAEASLLCSVPHLRPFDARVLVGAGIRHPQQLAQMHPSRLLERVEKFLATERGREIMRSGNSYELSRITSWIASAKNGAPQYRRSNFDDAGRRTNSSGRSAGAETPFGRRPRAAAARTGYTVVDREPVSHTDSEPSAPRARERSRRSRETLKGDRRHERQSARDAANSTLPAHAAVESDARWKFYLDLGSPVVDAPSIGPRMAERLARHGIAIVQQLLAANPENLAAALAAKNVSAETIRLWQEQSRLICRIPNLRGHDAQLLVLANVTSPEELARLQPEAVLKQVLGVARTPEGQRCIRGGKEPDLAEVTDWIEWASHCRTLQAA